MGGVENVKDPFAKRAWDDEPVVVEQKPVAFEHPVAELPVGTTLFRALRTALFEGRDHVGVLWLLCAGHGNIAC